MGDRRVKGSPRHGIPRDLANEAKSREHYEKRAEGRPKQVFDKATKTWSKAHV